jgi:molybdopterin-guanine dinucleotide biosynthesis protein A
MTAAPVFGLLLAGGRSRRMRQDKATLAYAGRSQLARALELLSPRVDRCFVSVRADQRGDPQRAAYELIEDLQPDLGPIGGIQAALHAHPDRAWLVLACDLPFLQAPTLDHLLARREPARLATAYRSSHDGLPEPLCAIFEPAALEAVDRWIAQGQRCPRALLGTLDTRLLDPPDPHALDNINTPEEYAVASAELSGTPAPNGAMHADTGRSPDSAQRASASPPQRLTVRYFALLREQAGRGQEELLTRAQTPLELYQELRGRHGLRLLPDQLRVAVNDEFSDWQVPLRAGDTIAFLPPVAGG